MRTEDGGIIGQCLNGEPEAFGMLVDKYKAGIYAYVYAKLRDFSDAQDMTQEVFLKAYRDLHSLKKWESFAFWLNRIASTQCAEFIRMRSKRPDSEFIEDHRQKIFEKPSIESYQYNQMNESLQEALNLLPETYREVLTLYYFGGMNSMEIAEAIGVSPATIRQRLSRARTQLKEEMVNMMSETFKEHRLQASFTFRIVEAVKHIRIKPVIQMKGVPLGLSLATGLIITFLSFNPHLISFDLFGTYKGASLYSETRVLKVGEIPVDIMKISSLTFISSEQGNGNGGKSKNSDQQNAFLLAPRAEGGKWTQRTDMPIGRQFISCSALNGKFYAIGGCEANRQSPRLDEYDPITDKWTQKVDMPTARSGHSTCVVNGKIYAIGGIGVLSTVEEYDPVLDKWTKKADMPTARWVFSAASVNGKIYVFGGAKEAVGLPVLPAKFIPIVEEYDPATDTWTKKGDMPKAIGGSAAAVVKDKIYIIGGGDDNVVRTFSSVWEYDPATDKWTSKADMPTPRGYLATAVVNDRIYAIGGVNRQFTMYSTVEEYDPATDKWTSKTDMPIARATLSADTVDGKIYVAGGLTAVLFDFLPTMEEYDPGDIAQSDPKSINVKGKLPSTWGQRKQ